MFMKFREFVSLQEAQPNTTMNTLQQAMNSQPPAGTNPQQYKNKLQQAMQVAAKGNIKSPNQAIDLVNVQMKAAQN